MNVFKEKLKKQKNDFEEFQRRINNLIEEVKEAEERNNLDVIENNGWQKFQKNNYQHIFLTVDGEYSNEFVDLVKNNIDNVDIQRQTENDHELVNIFYSP